MDGAAERPDVADQSQSQHFTRSQTRLFYKAAGVLPFSFQYGVPVILLGAELSKTGPQGKIYKTMWRDFGGQREAIDQDSETTASREFAEETMGLFGGCAVNGASVAACSKQMHTQLIQRQHVLKVVHQLKKGEYHMYVAQTPHLDPLMFHLALQQNAETEAVDGAEKTAFAWVALSDLLAATSSCAKRYFLNAHVHTTGNRRQPVVHGPRSLQLHPCFANSLRLAQEAGLLALVAAAQNASVPSALHEPTDISMLDTATASGLPEAALVVPCGDVILESPSGQKPTPSSAAGRTAATAVCKQRGVRGGRRAPKKHPRITPEHMLYWVSQADIAMELRCNDIDTPPEVAASQPVQPCTVNECGQHNAMLMTPRLEHSVKLNANEQCLPSRQSTICAKIQASSRKQCGDLHAAQVQRTQKKKQYH